VSHGSDVRSSGKRHRDNARQTGARLRPSIKQPAADRLTSLDLLLHTVCSCKALFLVVIISCITVYCHCILFIFSPRPLWIFIALWRISFQCSKNQKVSWLCGRFLFLGFPPPSCV
jgi:hypothetical protein